VGGELDSSSTSSVEVAQRGRTEPGEHADGLVVAGERERSGDGGLGGWIDRHERRMVVVVDLR
jgi:hypothetical protein